MTGIVNQKLNNDPDQPVSQYLEVANIPVTTY